MNGKVQGIIIGGVAVACLAGVMVFLQHTEFPSTDSSSAESSTATASEDESVVILEKTSDEIKSVYVNNSYGEYTLEKPASGKSNWTIDTLELINQNTSLEDSMRTNLGEMEAKKLVEKDVSDMSKYGLEEPSGYFTVTYDDDSQVTVYIGDEAPNGSSNYVRLNDENKVYLVQTTRLTYFTDPDTAYVSTSLIATPSDDEWPDYGTETVSRQDLDYDMVFETDPYENNGMVSAQVMTEPIFSYLNVTNSSDVTHGMWGLSATSCEVANPTDDDFAKYGLDDPFCTVSLKGAEYDYLLKIGDAIHYSDESSNETDAVTGYYCYLTGVSGVDCIFVISADSLPWATVQASDVVMSLMTSNYIYDLDEIDVEYDGEKSVYAITSNGTSDESTTDSGDSIDVTGVTLGGDDIDVDTFKSYYQYIMGCPTSEIYFTDPEETEPYLTISLMRKDGGSDVMEYYKETSRRTIVKLNGKTSFRIQSSWVDTFLENMQNVKDAKEIVTTY